MESWLGTVSTFAFGFTPLGWAPCNGQLLNIADYNTLYNLIGTNYGGDGVVTFAVPDLRGRVPIGTGQGPGLSNYVLGIPGGREEVTLMVNQMPLHTHVIIPPLPGIPVADTATTNDPTGNYFAPAPTGINAYNSAATSASNTLIPATAATSPAGGSQPFYIVKPYQVLNYCICIEGISPPTP